MGFPRMLAIGCAAALLSGCGGGGSATQPMVVPVQPADPGPLVQTGMPAPFNPATDSLTALDRMPLTSTRTLDDTFAAVRPSAVRARTPQSTIEPGDAGFSAGLAIAADVTAIYSIFSVYQPAQFAIPFPPSGSPTTPTKPERLFGPEIEPGASCLTAGFVMVNFGAGGTQRNGPGNPIQALSGPYNAYRVLDFCNPTPDATGKPPPVTFFLTPIDANFADLYVRPNESGLPAVVSEVFSKNADAFTNKHAIWYSLLWNFKTRRWNITNTSQGNVGGPGLIGDAVAYAFASSQNLPEVCPAIPPLIAQDISVLDPLTKHFAEPGFGDKGRLARALAPPGSTDPDFGPISNACFKRDATGPASFTFHFIAGKGLADWELKQSPALEPAPANEVRRMTP